MSAGLTNFKSQVQPGRSAGITEVKGWIVPGLPQEVICLDGLRYTVIGSSTQANLSDDVAAWMARPKPTYTRQSTKNKDFDSDTAVALLLMVGQPKLAEKVAGKITHVKLGQEFLRLSTEFLGNWWEKILTSHINSDCQVAFRNAVQLKKYRHDYETEGRKVLGNSWVQQMSRPEMGGKGVLWAFPFIEQVDWIVDDDARRINLGLKPPLDWSKVRKLLPEQRVAKLIENMDQITSASMSSAKDPIVNALLAEGKSAVVPLLTVMDEDTRLTQATEVGTGTSGMRQVISVKDFARSLLGLILNWTNISNLNGLPATSQQIREYLVRNGSGVDADRLFNVLDDDEATPEQWLEAVKKLMVAAGKPLPSLPQPLPAMKVQRLADDTSGRFNPSLRDLLKERVNQLVDETILNKSGPQNLMIALQMAIEVAAWDSVEALPLIAKASNAMMNSSSELDHSGAQFLAQAIEARVFLGDKAALYEYAQWLQSFASQSTSPFELTLFKPLVTFSNSVELKAVPDKVFMDSTSHFSLVKLAKEEPGKQRAQKIALSRLIQIPAVQRGIQLVLEDKTSLGSVVADNSTSYTLLLNSQTSFTSTKSLHLKTDPHAPKAGDHRDYRVCDGMAFALQRLKGAPPFELYWPDTVKDVAIKQLQSFLKAKASDLASLLPSSR